MEIMIKMKKRGTRVLTSELAANNLAKSKRSQSGVITTVLIILAVIAAVFIVYNVVVGMIRDRSGDIGTEKIDIPLETYSSDLSQNTIDVAVSRKAGEGNLTRVEIIFRNESGGYCEYSNDTAMPGELETVIYNVVLVNRTSGKPCITDISSYEVYPIVGAGKKEVMGIPALETTPSTPLAPPLPMNVYYKDADGDNYSDGKIKVATSPSAGYKTPDELVKVNEQAALTDDCDDGDGLSYPGASEGADDNDRNCDGSAEISKCFELNRNNVVYSLKNDITMTNATHCFGVSADDVTIDLGGHIVEGNKTAKCNRAAMAGNAIPIATCNLKNGDFEGCLAVAGFCNDRSYLDRNSCRANEGVWTYNCTYNTPSLNGIEIKSSLNNLAIKNGTIKHFGRRGAGNVGGIGMSRGSQNAFSINGMVLENVKIINNWDGFDMYAGQADTFSDMRFVSTEICNYNENIYCLEESLTVSYASGNKCSRTRNSCSLVDSICASSC